MVPTPRFGRPFFRPSVGGFNRSVPRRTFRPARIPSWFYHRRSTMKIFPENPSDRPGINDVDTFARRNLLLIFLPLSVSGRFDLSDSRRNGRAVKSRPHDSVIIIVKTRTSGILIRVPVVY